MGAEFIYTAAHAEFPDSEPLGGGKAVADYLIREWPGSLTVLSPKSLALVLPKPLTDLTELAYAKFCRQFERAATAEILRRNPGDCVVLSNDVAEGPDFRELGRRGYNVVTILHVDVVEYFAKFYLHGLVRPETLTRFRSYLWLPDVLRLVFQKQRECVQHSCRLVVPSEPMREMLQRCYPWCSPGKIVVLPWGNISAPHGEHVDLDISDDEFVIVTMSRLSPEKGIERLLKAMRDVDPVTRAVRLLICGAAAYMKGQAYERKLRKLAATIRQMRVEFTGHVTAARKAAILRRADLFVSPSRHESYGLTIAEAMAAGCPVISHDHYGANGQVVDCADREELAGVISELIAEGRTRKSGEARPEPPPSDAAKRLVALLWAFVR